MALTGKTIGQLTYLSGLTSNTLFPVELDGDTYHVMYSAFTSSNFTQITYSELYSLYAGGTMIGGTYYLISDYQTCYDQPNFDSSGNPITTGNFKSGSTEPLLVLATSNTSLSAQAFSPSIPNDSIKYDITFNFTEVTNTPAKGRITERIDNRNNRADYDFRAVQFIRYQAYFSENYYQGTASIDGSGVVTGNGTQFNSNFSVGDIIGFKTPFTNMIGCMAYYEILTITDDTNMTVTGNTFVSQNNVFYSSGQNGGIRSPYQCNVPSVTNSQEYYTFNDGENLNTYLGDNLDYNTFILSNNVFLNGEYINNTFGGNVVGNTFDDDMDSNTCGPYFQYNIITNDFDDNTIGPNFVRNFIDPDMQGNVIAGNFTDNMLGDYDGYDFDFNNVGWGFQYNFLTFTDSDFIGNIIGEGFQDNIINYGFENNTIGNNFSNNRILDTFQDNQIGSNFNNNLIEGYFSNNEIGESFYSNLVYSSMDSNKFGKNANTNTFGDPNNAIHDFGRNIIGVEFNNNYFSGYTYSNNIGDDCQYNNIDNNFSYNQIGSKFQSNTIANDFGFGGGTVRGNIVGNGFVSNTIGEYCYDNTFGDNCVNNNIADNFVNNQLSHGVSIITNDVDNSGTCQNNIFTFGNYTVDLTLSGGIGGNPYLYTDISCSVVRDVNTNIYVTFLSGGTFTVQSIIV